MLHEAQRTRAPSACSVSISTAVWMVMCSEPVMRAPRSGWVEAYSSRIAIRPGISVSAMRISLRPHSASDRSATWKSADFMEFGTADIGTLPVKTERRNDNGAPNQSKACERRYFLAEPGLPPWDGSQRSSAGANYRPAAVTWKVALWDAAIKHAEPRKTKETAPCDPLFLILVLAFLCVLRVPLRPLRQRFECARSG